jgi:hypothetical protein
MSLRRFKNWNKTKPFQPTLAQFELEDLLTQGINIDGCTHEAGISMWRLDIVLVRMTRKDFDSWVAFRERMKCENEMLRTLEGAEMKEWLVWKPNRKCRGLPKMMGPLERLQKGFGCWDQSEDMERSKGAISRRRVWCWDH